jgi:hypothetical protein
VATKVARPSPPKNEDFYLCENEMAGLTASGSCGSLGEGRQSRALCGRRLRRAAAQQAPSRQLQFARGLPLTSDSRSGHCGHPSTRAAKAAPATPSLRIVLQHLARGTGSTFRSAASGPAAAHARQAAMQPPPRRRATYTSGPAARTAAFRGRIHGCTRTFREKVRFFSLAPRRHWLCTAAMVLMPV